MDNAPAVQNPFGSSAVAAASNAIASSDEQRAIQEVQAAMTIAKKFPRDPMEAMDRIINACTRPTLAEAALYSYQRGGTEITGPSIRLAEAMAQAWGNMQFGIRELSSANSVSTVEAFCWDMETNTRQVKVFQVPHIRYSRNKGNEVLKDPRDIYELVANNGARRLRACILGVIPGDVTEAAVAQCDVTQRNNVDIEPEAIKTMVEAFAKWGVTQEMIEKRIQRRIDAINAPLMLNLRRIMRSVLDGMGKPSDWFPDLVEAGAPAAQVSDLKVKPAANKKRSKTAAAPAEPDQVTSLEPSGDPTINYPAGTVVTVGPDDSADSQGANVPETGQGDSALLESDPFVSAAGPATYAMVADQLNRAESPADLTAAVQAMADFVGTPGNEKFKAELSALYKARITTLKKAQAASQQGDDNGQG